MQLDRDILNRFLDGELGPEEMVRIARQVAAEPEWDSYLLSQEKFKAVLVSRFQAVETPLPRRLVDAVEHAPLSPWWLVRMRLREILSLRWLVPMGGVLAMGLAILWFAVPRDNLIQDASGRVIAAGTLAAALNTQLASANSPSAATQIGISFRDKTGRDCRTFANGSNTGLACRQGSAWRIQVLASAPPREDAGAAYQMAGAAMPEAIRTQVMATIAGSAFDAAAERAARDRGWPGQ